MKYPMDNTTKEQLKSRSVCDKCATQMNFIDVPFEMLPPNIQDLLLHFGLQHQVVSCPKCESNGIHVW